MRSWAITVLMALSGAIAAAAVCWPFALLFTPGQPQWWLQILAMLPLLLYLQHCKSARLAFAHAAVYASAWLCATFWWLFVAMNTYGGLPAVLAIVAVLGLACTLALYYGIAGILLWKCRAMSPSRTTLLFAALWTMAEMARGTWFTGFGWGAMAYAHTTGPLSHWIPVLGAYGVGALAAWCAASIVFIRRAGWLHRLSLVFLLLAGLLPGHFQITTSTGALSVALLQGNIPQDEKFDSRTGVPIALHWYAQHLQADQADLVLAPETAIPLLPQELPDGYWDALNQQVQKGHSALLTGIPLGDYTQGYTNSVIALQPGVQQAWRYDKHHLVPFGEFIPPLFKWFTRMMNIPLGDFNRGAIGQPSFAWKGQRIAPNICYEDLFGEELGARFIDPSLAPTVFANVSNLGWFGDTIAIDQHLQISRMRALEFQRPFLRATNTGATVIMDYQGNVRSSLPRLSQGVLLGTVEGRTGTTPFAWWVSRFGLWPLWLLGLAVLTMAMLPGAAGRGSQGHQRSY
ncbi:apolipoprotein N-acyltransferase [Rhodoferax lacus]|uniref:Apolipoprotein N-acyltransferase n=1 Tax=Rhodoferax lacus TaxID=2184758 RepID=A0A3E1RA77_9BURK|nr:apolipoprotein N-acyltransferase [Rhodoferax lacus]RFO96131.1 apolipoprotein N-acyltransferase [Rhodoferax lacus]